MAKEEPNVYANPNRKHRTSINAVSDSRENDERPQGLAGIFSNFADKSSMSGLPFITGADNKLVRAIWSCLLMAAFGLMSFHLYRLLLTYYEYKKQTQVHLSFSNLQFPAVTICNVNPLRMSQSILASAEMNEFIASVNPNTVMRNLQLEEGDDEHVGDQPAKEISDFPLKGGKKDKNRANSASQTQDKREKEAGQRKQSEVKRNNRGRGKLRKKHVFDEIGKGQKNITVVQTFMDEFIRKKDQRSWETESNHSGLWMLEQRFRQIFLQHSPSVRAQMGHQINDMLLQCSFAGRECVGSNFTLLLTEQYGNCYTLQYHKFVSRMSGPADGLQLTLFLETDEYVPGIANSKGKQVVIHDQGTIPFPVEEGLAVNTGSETFIGLRRVEVTRLSSPYGKCTSVKNFRKTYGFKYTRVACQKVCQQKRTEHECGCYDNTQQEINSFLHRSKNLQPCQSQKEMMCAMRLSLRFKKNLDTSCNCHEPCSEATFEKTVSMRKWPSPAFATLLSSAACDSESSACHGLPYKDEVDLRDEFINLVIYYEDLNYEDLKELVDYELDQFLSDVGGTIGLWIGLSFLALFEIIHLFIHIFLYICCGKRY